MICRCRDQDCGRRDSAIGTVRPTRGDHRADLRRRGEPPRFSQAEGVGPGRWGSGVGGTGPLQSAGTRLPRLRGVAGPLRVRGPANAKEGLSGLRAKRLRGWIGWSRQVPHLSRHPPTERPIFPGSLPSEKPWRRPGCRRWIPLCRKRLGRKTTLCIASRYGTTEGTTWSPRSSRAAAGAHGKPTTAIAAGGPESNPTSRLVRIARR